MDAVSLSYSSQVFAFFSISSQTASRVGEQLPAPEPDSVAPQPGPSGEASALSQAQAPTSSTAVTQSTQTEAFLDLHVRIQLAEQEQLQSRGHELRHDARRLLKQLARDVKAALKQLGEELPGLDEQSRKEIDELVKELKKALKEAFRGIFGERHRADRAPLHMGPAKYLSAVRSALDDLLAGLREITGENQPEAAKTDADAAPAAAQTKSQTDTLGAKPGDVGQASPGSASAGEAQIASGVSGADVKPSETVESAADPLESLSDIFDRFVRQLKELFASFGFAALDNDAPVAYSTSLSLTFAYFSRTTLELSTSSGGEAVNAVA